MAVLSETAELLRSGESGKCPLRFLQGVGVDPKDLIRVVLSKLPSPSQPVADAIWLTIAIVLVVLVLR